MAKPISNGGGSTKSGGGTSYTEKSYVLSSTGMELNGRSVSPDLAGNYRLSKSNDFLYIDGSMASSNVYSTTPVSTVSGEAGSDQLIFKQPSVATDFSVNDSFFANFRSFESVKVENGATNGATINLDDYAFAAGIRSVDGGAGNDVISFSDDPEDAGGVGYSASNVSVNGGGGDDTIATLDGDDKISGGAGVDTIDAGAGNDTIVVGSGDDDVGESYNGGEGDDTLRVTGNADLSNDTLTDIENLVVDDNNGSNAITVTISESQLTDLTSITKGADDLVALDGSDGNVALSNTDGWIDIISSLEDGDTIDFAGLDGVTTFSAAQAGDAIDTDGEWTFDSSTHELSYWDGANIQSVLLMGVSTVTADGGSAITVGVITA